MSSITITFQTQALDFQPLTRGRVELAYNDGSITHLLSLILVQGVSTSGRFTEVAWQGGSLGEDDQQAANYAQAFNRDFKSVGNDPNGGLQPSNLGASVTDNVVTITARKGTFPDGQSNYTGNVLIVSFGTPDNDPQVPELALSKSITGTGDCNTVRHTFSASGGTPPYVLEQQGTVIDGNWDGSPLDVDVQRGKQVPYTVTDSNGGQKTLTVNSPRQLMVGEFDVSVKQFDGYSDLTVNNLNPVANTEPIEYSIDMETATTGGSYQASNVFPGVLPGIYKLFVKDRYGCEISKLITVSDFQDPTLDQAPRYFEIMEGNSIIFYPCKNFDADTKRNFMNTGSRNEAVGRNYVLKQDFVASDVIGTQFKSSYPYHIVTLIEDGTKKDLAPIQIQKNLGVKEKVDCKAFTINGKTGIYFDGGNEYVPDTETVVGPSPYQPNPFDNRTFLPDWAEEGQLVFLDGIGGLYIEGTGYDDTRGGYFVVDVQLGQDVDTKVQVTHNVQPYDLFEFYVPISEIGACARIQIEKGFAFDQIDGDPWFSEIITKVTDTREHVLVEATSSRNRGGMVYQSGISFKNRIIGKFRPTWDGESETALEDDGMSSLKQSSYQNYILEFEALTAKQVNRLNIVSGLDGFKVNNVGLTRTEFPQVEPLEDSNLYSWRCILASSGDELSVERDEIVLNVSTGKEGGGAYGQSRPDPVPEQIKPLAINGDILTIDGEMILMD